MVIKAPDLSTKKYFIFDLDGTLVDLENMNFSLFRETIHQYLNLDLSFAEYKQFFAGSGSEEGFKRFMGQKGVENVMPDELVKHYREQKWQLLESDFDFAVVVKPGAREYLSYLKDSGKKIALGTSTHEKFASYIIERETLRDYFDTIVTVDNVSNTKPAPDIFLMALQQLGAENNENDKNDAVIFEDTVNGILAAKAAGIDYVLVHSEGKNDEIVPQSEYVIEDYRVLLPREEELPAYK